MSNFEYKAIIAPRKGKAAKGLRGAADKFANAVTSIMNEMSAQGWEYLRADTLPSEERQGLTGKVVKYQSLLIFRRTTNDLTNIDTLLAQAESSEASLEHEAEKVLDDESDAIDVEISVEDKLERSEISDDDAHANR